MSQPTSSSPNYSVKVLYDGYSRMEDGTMRANCTCTLIKGPNNMIIDTMTAWDRDKIVTGKLFVHPCSLYGNRFLCYYFVIIPLCIFCLL